jgi:hypothetical protein
MIQRFALLVIVAGCVFSVPTVSARELPVAPAFLANIHSEDDLKNLSQDQQKELAAYREEISGVNTSISSLQLLSCSSEKLAGQGTEFSFSPAEKIVFKCQVKNPGTSPVSVFLTNKIVPDGAKDEAFSSVSGYVGEVAPGTTVAFDMTFLSPVLPGKYRYDVSLALLDDSGMLSKVSGQALSYTGSLGVSDVKIVSADFDKDIYQWGEQGTLKAVVSKADPTMKFSMDAFGADGNACANLANSFLVMQAANEYRFSLPEKKPACDIKTIKVSLLSKEGFPLESKTMPVRIGEEMSKAVAPAANSAVSQAWPLLWYGMAGIVALSVIAFVIIFVKRKRSAKHIYGVLWLFGAMALWGHTAPSVLAAETQTIGVSAATYSGWEQTIEATKISGMLSKAGSNGGVTGQVQEANSYYVFRATNGTYFTLNGSNIGSTLTIVHWRDGLGFASYACDWSNCSFTASFGRGGGMTVGVVSATVISGISSSYLVGGGAYNGGEQALEATQISWGMTLAGGNGGVGGWSSYRNSSYNFTATNGVYFTIDGVNIGSSITINHGQDWVSVTNAGSWGRWNRTLGVVAPPVPVVPPVPPAVPAAPPLIRATPAVDIKVNGGDAALSNVAYGASLTISWSTIEADSCTASGLGWTGPKAASGSETITAADNTTYTLTCTNIIGSNTDSIVVTLVPLAVTLTVNGASGTTSIAGGATVPVSWSAPGATTSCEILSGYGWAGANNARPASGTDSVTIGTTSDYTMRCIGAGSGTTTVHVNAVCTPSTGTWGSCDCDTETKLRTNINASCMPWTETDACTADEKNACRDFNWKEVTP